MCWEDAGGVQILQMKMLPLPAPGVGGSTPFPARFRAKERECATTAYRQENIGVKNKYTCIETQGRFKKFQQSINSF